MSSVSPDISVQTYGEEVKYLDPCKEREAHEKSQETAAVGQKVHYAVQLVSFGTDELLLFKEERHSCHCDPKTYTLLVCDYYMGVSMERGRGRQSPKCFFIHSLHFHFNFILFVSPDQPSQRTNFSLLAWNVTAHVKTQLLVKKTKRHLAPWWRFSSKIADDGTLSKSQLALNGIFHSLLRFIVSISNAKIGFNTVEVFLHFRAWEKFKTFTDIITR